MRHKGYITILNTSWKSISAGIGYFISLIIPAMILQGMGAKMPKATGNMNDILITFFISGILLSCFLGPIIKTIKVSFLKRSFILFSILFLNSASLIIEATFFVGGTISRDMLPSILFQQFTASLVTGLIIASLFFPRKNSEISLIAKRPWYEWLWRLAICSVSYVIFYYIFGNINYQLITKPYYEAHMSGLTIPTMLETLQIEPIRGIMMVLSITPFIAFSSFSKRKTMLLSGFILFVVGGAVPLLSQISALPIVIIAASLFEIFFQNFLTGVVSTHLLRDNFGERNSTHMTENY